MFPAITVLKAIQSQNVKHGRVFILIEASEESGSPDLPFWIDRISDRLGEIGLVVCLDSGCGNYEQFWLTSTLRGVITTTLKVQCTYEGVHSGAGSGIIPDSFRIIRSLLNRIEDCETGHVLLEDLHTEVPPIRIKELQQSSETLGNSLFEDLPFLGDAQPVHSDPFSLLKAKTWEPKLSYIGVDGFPDLKGGNVLRPYTTLKLSMRIPPHIDGNKGGNIIVETLMRDPPYGAQVEAKLVAAANGWEAPHLEPWLEKSVNDSSLAYFGKPALSFGEGGTIPFMNMLGVKFPKAQFVITGVLGPKSNAHGPNEFLHVGMGKGITCCCALILHDYMNK